MIKTYNFQVVIPTVGGREKYLKDAILSVLAQKNSAVEVIVSNNGADENVKKCVESFNSSKVIYVETPNKLAMSEHWEFAISHVTADFFTIIGDDDALTEPAIDYLCDALEQHPNSLSFVHTPAQYFWPDYLVKEHRNLYILHGGNTGKISTVATKKIYNEVFGFREHYGKLPFLYHGFISTKLVRKIQKIEGRIFARIAPDVYSDLLLAEYLDEHILIDAPLSIGGQGAKSNGANVFNDSDEGKKFFCNLPEFLVPIRPGVSINLQLFEYLEKIKKETFKNHVVKISWSVFVFRCMIEAVKYRAYNNIIIQGVEEVLAQHCPLRKRAFLLIAINVFNMKLVRIIIAWLLSLRERHQYAKWGNAVTDFSAKSVIDVAREINKRK